MANNNTNMPVDEQLAMLSEKIKHLANGDNLIIRVSRRKNALAGGANLSIPELIASFVDGRAAHMAQPELWIPQLGGGGQYLLEAFAVDDATKPLTGKIPFSAQGDARDVDPNVTRLPNWRGPPVMTFPERMVQQPQAQQGPMAPYQINIAPPASAHTAAPQTQASGAPMPGVHFQHGYGQPPPGYIDPQTAAYIAQKEREIERERAELRIQTERINAEARLAAMEARLEAKAREMHPPTAQAPRGESIGEVIKGIATAFAPIFVGIMDNARADRAAREAQEARRDERHQQFMQTVMTKPSVDPVILTLLERKDANEVPAHAMLTSVGSAMSSMVQMNMEMARAVAESSGAPPESPMLAAFREISAAVEKIAVASMKAAVPKPRAAPRPPPPVQQQGQASRAAASPQNPQPSQGQQQPHVRPSEAVIDGTAQPVQNGFNGAPEAQPAHDLLKELEDAIRSHVDPQIVAARLVEIFHTQQFQDALAAANGDIPELFNRQLGEAWGMDRANHPYIEALLDAVVEKGQAAGIFKDENEQPEEGQQEGTV